MQPFNRVLLASTSAGFFAWLFFPLGFSILVWGWLRAIARFEFRGLWGTLFTFIVGVFSVLLFGFLFYDLLVKLGIR